ncbi:MAG TPA: hypothetical protein VNO33_03580 [Kofleriaceae bacterium]|nr:hypothetical protein [Kofleriaceae bacterium]
MKLQFLFPIILMAVFLAYSLYTVRRRRAGMPQAFRMFFERTGYRYAEIADRPLEEQIAHGQTLMAGARGGYRAHMLRDYHGLPVHSVQETGHRQEGGKSVSTMSASWFCPLAQAPRIRLQVAERSLTGGLRKGLAEAFTSRERVWHQAYPLAVESGDAELDRRFQFFGYDQAAVRHALSAPGLRELLLGCAEVDLVVHADRVEFADPMQKNMTAGMGGTIGMMAMGGDMTRWMEMTIPVHDRIAQLLGTAARACA